MHSSRSSAERSERRRGFSLTELIVVISITVILTGLLLPAMSHVRENARRIICASNERQMGMAALMYTNDNNDSLPYSVFVDPEYNQGMREPWELMASRHPSNEETGGWDGLGLLYPLGYCQDPGCFYCPSHSGHHPIERYEDRWMQGLIGDPDSPFNSDAIYTNYHYAGHLDWETGARRTLLDGFDLVLITDGLRTQRDFNHGNGMNVLRGDGSVHWNESASVREIRRTLPISVDELDEESLYDEIWTLLDK